MSARRLPPAEILAFAAAFAVFALMAAPGVTWMDAGELTAAAYTLGGAHPPGHPGHTLLGKLATLVPLGEIAFRVNLLSAATMAAAVAGAVALTRALVAPSPMTLAAVAALAILSPVVQVNATRAEVYGPVAALLCWAMVATVRFGRAAPERRDGRLVVAAAAGCALAAAIHPLMAAAAAVPMAIYLALRAGASRLPRLAPLALGAGALGLLLYAYLPLRANAASTPLLMWGDPDGAAALYELIRAPAYQDNFEVAGWPGRAAALFLAAGEGMGAGLLFGGLLGLGFAVLTGLRGAAVVLGGALAVVAGAGTQHAFNPDMPGYVLPALLFLAAGLGALTEAVARMLPIEAGSGRWRDAAAAVVLAPLIGLGAAVPVQRAADAGFRRGDDALALWTETVALLPPGPALYVANGDHALFPAQYERLVAGGRPDVAVASAELARDRWHLRHIKRMLPELYVPFVDDGVRGATAERLAVTNLRAGRPVGASVPAFGRLRSSHAAAFGRGYLFTLQTADALPGQEARPPPAFGGAVGARVAGDIGLTRALYEAERGRLGAAAVAAGLQARFGSDIGRIDAARPSRQRPAMYGFVPRLSPVFIFEPWQAELFGDDLAWVAGLPAPELTDRAAPERRLHALWRKLLEGELAADSEALAGFGRRAELAVARMLLATGRLEAAEARLAAALEAREDAEALVLSARLHLARDRPAEARAALERALELAPDRADAAALLAELAAAGEP